MRPAGAIVAAVIELTPGQGCATDSHLVAQLPTSTLPITTAWGLANLSWLDRRGS